MDKQLDIIGPINPCSFTLLFRNPLKPTHDKGHVPREHLPGTGCHNRHHGGLAPSKPNHIAFDEAKLPQQCVENPVIPIEDPYTSNQTHGCLNIADMGTS